MCIFLKLYFSPISILILTSLISISSWDHRGLTTDAATSLCAGSPGAVFAHLLQLGYLARAWRGKHRGSLIPSWMSKNRVDNITL